MHAFSAVPSISHFTPLLLPVVYLSKPTPLLLYYATDEGSCIAGETMDTGDDVSCVHGEMLAFLPPLASEFRSDNQSCLYLAIKVSSQSDLQVEPALLATVL